MIKRLAIAFAALVGFVASTFTVLTFFVPPVWEGVATKSSAQPIEIAQSDCPTIIIGNTVTTSCDHDQNSLLRISPDGGASVGEGHVLETTPNKTRGATPDFGFDMEITKDGGCVGSAEKGGKPDVACNSR